MASCWALHQVREAHESSAYWHRSVEPAGVGCRKVSQGKPVLWGCHLHKHSQVTGLWTAGGVGCSAQCLPAQLRCQGSAPQPGPTPAWPKAGSTIPSSLHAPVLPPGQLPHRGLLFWDSLDLLCGAVLQPGCPSEVSHSLVPKGQAGVLLTCEILQTQVPFSTRNIKRDKTWTWNIVFEHHSLDFFFITDIWCNLPDF